MDEHVEHTDAPRESTEPEDENLEPSTMLLNSVSFEGLDPTDFEEFCRDLLIAQGFINVDWRKGTPKQASPADSGRDIVAQLQRRDVDGHIYHETWFVDCKHYKTGVPPDALQGLTAWATTERADVALVICSGFLSNPSKDWVAQYKANNRPPFRLRYWERPEISSMLSAHMELAWKHNVSHSELRRLDDIIAAENELYEKVWYGRKPAEGSSRASNLDAKLEERMRAAMKEIEDKYGKDELMATMADGFSWGMLSGKLSALRWVLGEDWDMLDT